MKKKVKIKSRGFTLIELLVVIAIIGLLASVVVTSLSSTRAKARDTKRISDLKQMKLGLDLFLNHGNGYPTKVSFDAAIAAKTVLTCGTVPTVLPVQDPLYPQSGYLYNYTDTGAVTSGCGGANNLNTDYQITFTLEKTGATTYTMNSNGQFSPALPSI
ncbi:MAG: hypothetical protein A2826_02870 [Candidatus Doudnabacteria bacterium RIFCSPHIGHO2_01_FULL_43_23]|uniref:Type II secretion system protein GspG C-terminal domain-containing protein n=1 Tax=Candidatus Doudnabacteria bacterium RIFCSPHIGHO2_01_FULL_43_23 TaxID=1817822 RepID=A0A1F5NS39_9BACT|nr:MAG: hypothetical protein A2826_02870 [Candidatus Doudnabacteria bacterium RIFCSPHIGHO2_01_FULL_43_23]